jgi:anti-sigma B factor antagonist
MNFGFTITEKTDNIGLIELEGDLNFKQDASDLLYEFEKRISEYKTKYIVNLGKLDHINSSGLNILIMLLTKARKAGGEVVITHVSEKIQKLFAITRLNSFFTVKENDEEAVKELNTI